MKEKYEVVIIGGGINGAGVAQAAAAAGYRTLIIEKDTWAYGTSSKSSKLIHGGLRYLQSGRISLVWKCLRERELLLKLAPNLIKRSDFYLPVYQNSHYKSWQLRIGLTLYALLAGGRKACRFKTVPKALWPQIKNLNPEGLIQVFHYHDAQTDDRLLTQAVIESAKELGADTLCHAELLSAVKTGNHHRIKIKREGTILELDADTLINAAGPWANKVNSVIQPTPASLEVDLVQGTHLIIKGKLADRCYYLEAPQDQRAIFALPWYENTLVGTTETLFKGDPDQVAPLADEEHYLLTVLARYFPDCQPKVIERFAGLRVLPHSRRPMFLRSRETQLVCDNTKQPTVVTIYGGKLTSYRTTADKVARLIRRNLGKRPAIADTAKLVLKHPANEHPFPSANTENAD